jgi:uncharacterized membrane-anchored protein YitT (DUF2179 family)
MQALQLRGMMRNAPGWTAIQRLWAALVARMSEVPVLRLVGIAAGAMLAGAAINGLNIANGLVEGGVTGIAVLLKLAAGLDPGLVSLALNLPLLYLGWRRLGWQAVALTAYGTLCLSASLSLFGWLRLPMRDLLLVSLLAGALVGLGLGIIFRLGGTSGGVDILARLANHAWGWPMGRTIFVADLVILGASLLYLDLERALYTVVAVFVAGRVIDVLQEAAHAAVSITVVTEHPNGIARRVLAELGRGVTEMQGTGSYTGQQKAILWVVVAPRQLRALKRIVAEEDPTAFVSLTPVREVMGEGFHAA